MYRLCKRYVRLYCEVQEKKYMRNETQVFVPRARKGQGDSVVSVRQGHDGRPENALMFNDG